MTSGRRVRVVSGRLDDHSQTLAARALEWDADSQAVPERERRVMRRQRNAMGGAA